LTGKSIAEKAEDYRNSLQQEAQAKAQALHFKDELARKRMSVLKSRFLHLLLATSYNVYNVIALL
jgi:hypothetical protein